MPTVARYRLACLAAALLFSTGGAAIKGTALNAFQVASFRSGVAAVAIAILIPAARRGFGLDLLPTALAFAVTMLSFVIATKLTTSAAAIFLQSTAPVWVLVLAPLLLHEKIRRTDLPYVGLAALGLLLVFLGSGGAESTVPRPALGNAVALASGLFYAVMMVTMRRLSRGTGSSDRSLAAAVLGNAIACLVCLPLALPVAGATVRDVVGIVYLGVVQIGVAYAFFSYGLRGLSALEVSLLVLLEPVLNPVWTWLLTGERPSALALAGGGVMVTALATRAILDRPAAPDVPPVD